MFTCRAGGTAHQHSHASEGRSHYASLTAPGRTTTLGRMSAREIVAETARQQVAEVPAGRYALRSEDGSVRFFRVDRPTEGRWAGYVFVRRQAGDVDYPVRIRQERESILAAIGVDVEAASRLYGTELGVCGDCGRILTNDESRAAGIGPICAGKKGW